MARITLPGPVGLKDTIETIVSIAGLIALLTPALGVLERLVSFALTEGIGYQPQFAIGMPIPELTFVGLVAAVPLFAVLGFVGLGISLVGSITASFAIILAFSALAVILFLPPFPTSIGYVVIALLGLALVRSTRPGDPRRSLRPLLAWATLLVLASGVAFGFNYRAGQAAEYQLDSAKAPGTPDGMYLRLGQDDTFLYLFSCSAYEASAVPINAVTRIRFEIHSLLPGPSLFQVLLGEPLHLGAGLGCQD